MEKQLFKVLTTFTSLNEDQLQRVGWLVAGEMKIDSWGAYEVRGGQVKQLDAIVFRDEPLDDAGGGGHTTIDGIDNIQFEKSPSIYLKATDGTLTGWHDCRAAEQPEWHFGVLFRDDEGKMWFAGRNEMDPKGELTTAEVSILRPVVIDTSDMVSQFGFLDIMDDVETFEAEIWINPESSAHPSYVTSISMGSQYGSRPEDTVLDERMQGYLDEQRAALNSWRKRIREMAPADDVVPS